MPTAATILTVTALGLGFGAAALFESKQARARDEARRRRTQLPPELQTCAGLGPVYSLAGQPVGRYTGPGDGDCWPECPEDYELIETEEGPRCSSTIELPDLPQPEPEPDYAPYVGSGWTDWPHKEWFLDEESFAQVLMNLGYMDWASTCVTPQGRFLAEPCAAIIGAFQEDFNLVREYLREAQDVFMAVEPLELTERLDAPTITALLHALRIEQESSSEWPEIVSSADLYFS